jgi:LPXTG-motif cell wall-anchored protein
LMTGVVVTAFAVPVSAAAPGGPYGGFAQATAVHADVLNITGIHVVNAEVGQAGSAVASEGLHAVYNEYGRPIVPKKFVGKNSYGNSSVLEAGLGVDKDTIDQIQPFYGESAAPGGPPAVDKSIVDTGTQADPLLYLDLAHNQSAANWNANTCVIGKPISFGQQRLTKLQLLDMGTATPTGFTSAVLGIHADSVPTGDRGATQTFGEEILRKGSGPGLALESAATATIAPVTFLSGTANEFTIEVGGPAYLTATADGTPGGAKVKVSVPTVSIIQGGVVVAELSDSLGITNTIIQIPPGVPDAGDFLAQIKISTLLPLNSESSKFDKTTKADGTFAAASGNVIEVKILNVPEVPLTGATIGIGHMEVASQVPVGGVSCPIPVTKTADVDTVRSGESFTTSIKVDNPFSCPLVLSKVTDDITTEGDSTFQVTSGSPTPDSPSLPTASGLTSSSVVWKDLGTIPPGGSKTITVTLKAGGGAGKILDTATAEGAVTNCAAGPGSGSTDVTGLSNANVPVNGVGTLTVPETKVLGVTLLPKTGLSDGAYSWAGILMLLAAVSGGSVLRRRKFKLDS